MLSELEADKSTIYRQVPERGGPDLGDRGARDELAEMIGTLIACRMRQRYVMLCEAELDSGDRTGWRPGAGGQKVRRKVSPHVGRSANHPQWTLLAWKRSQSKKQIRRQNGYEDLNLFAWTSV
jgi:hypothetical protein